MSFVRCPPASPGKERQTCLLFSKGYKNRHFLEKGALSEVGRLNTSLSINKKYVTMTLQFLECFHRVFFDLKLFISIRYLIKL